MKFLKQHPLFFGSAWLIFWFIVLAVLVYRRDTHGISADWIRAAGYFVAGLGVAPLALWLAHQRTESLLAQTSNESARRITDAFTKAVELLGHENPAVRQGGIYALGRLANENKNEHAKIIDIVAAYIRKESPAYETSIDITSRIGIDVEAAVAVIRDRKVEFDREVPDDESYVFDLSNCRLIYADLAHANLANVNLSDCVFVGCVFDDADLTKAHLVGSRVVNSDFQDTTMVRTNLSECVFKGCLFEDADLIKADLFLSEFASFESRPTNFKDAKFEGADIYAANFSALKVGELTQDQVDLANGDKYTRLPLGLRIPPHWFEDEETQ